MATKTRLQILGEEEVPAPPTAAAQTQNPTSDTGDKVAVSVVEFLKLLLSVLSQRAIMALHHLLPIVALVSGFALWWRVLPEPTEYQLVGLGLYAAFMLAILFVRRQ
jgi:hypothetical protein